MSQDSLKRMDRKAFRLGLAAIAGILGLPFVVTQCTFGYELGVNGANEIGDTLGGVLGPFISLISASLVYLALREQIKANNLIHDQFENEKNEKAERLIFEEVLKELDIIIEDIQMFKFQENSNFKYASEPFAFAEAIEISLYGKEKPISKFDLEYANSLLIRFTNQLNFLVENVQHELSFYKIINIRIDKIERFLLNPKLIDFSSKSRFSGNQYFEPKRYKNFQKIVDWLKPSIQVKEKLGISDYSKIFSDALTSLERIMALRKRFLELINKLEGREKVLEAHNLDYANGIISKESLKEKKRYTNEVYFKDLDENFKSFLDELDDHEFEKNSITNYRDYLK